MKYLAWLGVVVILLMSCLLVAYVVVPLLKQKTAPIPKVEDLVFIGGTKDPTRRGDVVFVHGLDGDARGTWTSDTDPRFFWPDELAKEFPDMGVWSIDYDAYSTDWIGSAMALPDRSKNLIARLKDSGIGEQKVVYIGHSLGGLVIKQMLKDLHTQNDPTWERLKSKSKGVVFIATPHSGSVLATMVNWAGAVGPVGANVTVDNLRSNDANLRDLNTWYRQNARRQRISTRVFFENLEMGQPPMKIVDECSADPGIEDAIATAVQANHVDIAKPKNAKDAVYLGTAAFIKSVLRPKRPDYKGDFKSLVEAFNLLKLQDLKTFKELHVDQRVTITAVVRGQMPATRIQQDPQYWIAPSADSPMTDYAVAVFEPSDFDDRLPNGSVIQLEGTVWEDTNPTHIFFHECIILKK